jgi:hypothetical protein
MSDAAQDILQSLIRERGGANRFDQTQLVVASKLAEMLASDATVSAPAIVALSGLLPAKPTAGEPEYDLSRLSDEEFAELDRLSAKAADATLPPAPVPEALLRLRTPRQRQAEELALLIDALEGEQEAARRANWRQPWSASDDDLMDIRNCIVALLGLVATESAIFRYLLDGG